MERMRKPRINRIKIILLELSLYQRLHKKVSVVLGELEEDLIQKLTAIPLSKISES